MIFFAGTDCKSALSGTIDRENGNGSNFKIDLNQKGAENEFVIGHETGHAIDVDNGVDSPIEAKGLSFKDSHNKREEDLMNVNNENSEINEKSASHTENIIRGEVSNSRGILIPLRETYNLEIEYMGRFGTQQVKTVPINVKKKVMIVTNKISILIMMIVFSSCSSQKSVRDNSTYSDDCEKFIKKAEAQYEGLDREIFEKFEDFNFSKNKSIDIIRITSDSGYETKEYSKRVYLQNNKIYISDSNGTREASNISYATFKDFYKNLKGSYILVNCNVKSSRRFIYRYFVKIDNKLVRTFYANNIPENIEKSLIEDEIDSLNFFENIK